eukprot:scaffold5788_cov95-Isochrysis_galbana.AAC.3
MRSARVVGGGRAWWQVKRLGGRHGQMGRAAQRCERCRARPQPAAAAARLGPAYLPQPGPNQPGTVRHDGALSFIRPPASLCPLLCCGAQGSRIVGFEVEPSSIKHSYTGEWKGAETKLSTCGGGSSAPLAMKGDVDAIFTYDVKWEFSDIKWASRWDTYLLMGEPDSGWRVPGCQTLRGPSGWDSWGGCGSGARIGLPLPTGTAGGLLCCGRGANIGLRLLHQPQWEAARASGRGRRKFAHPPAVSHFLDGARSVVALRIVSFVKGSGSGGHARASGGWREMRGGG